MYMLKTKIYTVFSRHIKVNVVDLQVFVDLTINVNEVQTNIDKPFYGEETSFTRLAGDGHDCRLSVHSAVGYPVAITVQSVCTVYYTCVQQQ
jgi:hypothetical protein